MSRDDYAVAAAALNGRPQRLISIVRTDGMSFRDQINADSAISRGRFIGRAVDKFGVEATDLDWLDDAIVAAADDADAQADAAVGELPSAERKSQATQLVEFGSHGELFHDSDGETFARFEVDGHFEVAGIRAKHFRRWMSRLYFLAVGKAPSSQALQDAIGVLEGKAIFEGPQRSVHVRVAEFESKIYVDLCNAEWQVVEVSSTGWRILDQSPVMFRRAKAMLPLPVPVDGGSVNELRQFINIGDDDWVLFQAWLVAALRPSGPYPVLDIQGEHGSGKSTACRMARALVDPNTAMLRSDPREPRDLMIASKNGWIIALDNLSGIQAWQSDCLCRLSTGGGFSTRTLYENDEETIFDAQRPVIINGIDEVATRADLLDRCLLLNLPRIEQVGRRPEAELWATFEEARPRILGALLTAVASAMDRFPQTNLSSLPRLADFALWTTAAETGLGLEAGAFMTAYSANREAGNEMALDASPIGKQLVELVEQLGEWAGTAAELLAALNSRADDSLKRLKSWPQTARSLGSTVRRIAPNLRQAGIDAEFGFEGSGRRKRRVMRLVRKDMDFIVPTDPTVPTSENKGPSGDDGGAKRRSGGDVGTQPSIDVSPCATTAGTVGDDGDANWGDDSNRVSPHSPLRGLCTGRLAPEDVRRQREREFETVQATAVVMGAK